MTLAETRRLKKKSHNISSLGQQNIDSKSFNKNTYILDTSTYLVNYIYYTGQFS